MVMEVDEPATSSQEQPMDTSEGPVERDFEPSDHVEWRFSQVKGNIDEEGHAEADIISCVEFSHDGEYLATGDRGGRVVIFQRDQSGKYVRGSRSRDYNVYSTFQSHEPEFDYLKSLEIEEKINQIRWLKKKNAANFILSTNDKTVKLWKISERERKMGEDSWNLPRGSRINQRFSGNLKIPSIVPMELIVEASPRRVYGNAHTYHVNSISVNSDQETFLSSDDLRMNLWNLEITNEAFSIVDIKPKNMDELTEVITAAAFHPQHCNWFVYSSSKGTIRLCDMRDRALCDMHAKKFEELEDPNSRSFFSEIIASVSDVKFSNNGRYLLTRDYLTCKVYDMNMDTRPVETYPIHEHLRTKLCALYENDSIFDKFECGFSADDKHIITGSYHNLFRTIPRGRPIEDVMLWEARPQEPNSLLRKKKVVCTKKKNLDEDQVAVDTLEFNKKVLHAAWHPKENIIALGATNNLYVFSDK